MGFTIHQYRYTYRGSTFKFTYDADNRIKNWKYVWRGWANNPISNKKHWTAHYKSYNGAKEHAVSEMLAIIRKHVDGKLAVIEDRERENREAKRRAEELERKTTELERKAAEEAAKAEALEEKLNQEKANREEFERRAKEEQIKIRNKLSDNERVHQTRVKEFKSTINQMTDQINDLKATNDDLIENQEVLAKYIIQLTNGMKQIAGKVGLEVSTPTHGLLTENENAEDIACENAEDIAGDYIFV